MVLKTLKEFCDSVIKDIGEHGDKTPIYVNPNEDGVYCGFDDEGESYVVVGGRVKSDDGGDDDDLS